MKLYIVAFHQNRLDEAILIYAIMYSYIQEQKKKLSQIYIKLFYYQQPCYLTITKINMRQYVVFIKPPNFDTADIKCFTI